MDGSVTAVDCEGQAVLGSPGMYPGSVILPEGWGGDRSGHVNSPGMVLMYSAVRGGRVRT